ncbi:hypothetical protein [Agrococcus sp. ARC_14]|uniref:hypothetical protein n=1 Tax=Agrococcus sp. ARC_14 TaxID=2919927 RepID=UPI001F06BD1B|nr:hypothetical protein [Agrococcus sp. ARC_14]MCH1881817.1 hypothetical protein [Agrococcus sp. ARC_14]
MDGKRDRRLEDWVELAAAAVERARRSIGNDEVAKRVEDSVSDEDYEAVVRVLRTMGRDLQSTSADLTSLDARLRAGHVEQHPHVPESPEDAAPTEDAMPAEEPEVEQNPESTLGDLPAKERANLTPAELAKQLARLRNPILPHPRRGRRT